jgi:hypothetical protein
MKNGDAVYRAGMWFGTIQYPPSDFVFEGTVFETRSVDGTSTTLWVRNRSGTLETIDAWRTTRSEAMRDAHRNFIRYIGMMQARADELAVTILAADLAPQPELEVANGVA